MNYNDLSVRYSNKKVNKTQISTINNDLKNVLSMILDNYDYEDYNPNDPFVIMDNLWINGVYTDSIVSHHAKCLNKKTNTYYNVHTSIVLSEMCITFNIDVYQDNVVIDREIAIDYNKFIDVLNKYMSLRAGIICCIDATSNTCLEDLESDPMIESIQKIISRGGSVKASIHMVHTNEFHDVEWYGSFARCIYETCKLHNIYEAMLTYVNSTELLLLSVSESPVNIVKVIVTNKWGERVRYHKLMEGSQNEL